MVAAFIEDLGIDWVSCVGQDTRKDGWGLTIQILLAMSEAERKKASYRTRRGQEGIAKSGRSAGGKVYGYIPQDERIPIQKSALLVVKLKSIRCKLPSSTASSSCTRNQPDTCPR